MSTLHRSLLVLTLAVVGAIATPAGAMPIQYDELVDGDLAQAFLFPAAPTDIGVLDVGANTLSGRLTAPYDTDAFSWTLPPGLKVASAAVQVSYVNCGSSALCDWLISGNGFSFFGNVLRPANDVMSLGANLPPGVYAADVYSTPEFGDSLPAPPLQRYIAYTLTFNVVPVPAPPVVALVPTALLALWPSLRRRRARLPGI